MTLKLVTNETDSRNKATVRGELKYYPKFLEFGINTSKTWEPVQLSKFFKMNRAFFKDAQYNMELVTVLKNFKASIDSKVENSRQDNGSRTDNYSQVVNSNLPASFNLIVPIFKGRPAEDIICRCFVHFMRKSCSQLCRCPYGKLRQTRERGF